MCRFFAPVQEAHGEKVLLFPFFVRSISLSIPRPYYLTKHLLLESLAKAIAPERHALEVATYTVTSMTGKRTNLEFSDPLQ